MSRTNIGAVSFAQWYDVNDLSAGWQLLDLCGEERVSLLYRVMRGEALPEGLVCVGQREGGWRVMSREEVEWEGLTWRG